MKICIIGFGDSRSKAPVDDKSWIKYGLPWDGLYWEKIDVHFEMHTAEVLNIHSAEVMSERWDGKKTIVVAHRPDRYGERMKNIAMNKTLYMHKSYLPHATPFPFKKINAFFKKDYYVSSVSYMLAMAIYQISQKNGGKHEIGLWGIDLAEDGEWEYQRANNEYYIGVAEGMGIKVYWPEESKLCKYLNRTTNFGGVMVTYGDRYGKLGPEPQEFFPRRKSNA
jgi:hypothetical protein